jgi:hypothetical protein
MLPPENARRLGVIGMAGALLYVANLLVEYRYDLFPPGAGVLYTANQLGFYTAMALLLLLLVGLWRVRATGDSKLGRLSLGLFIAGWAALIVGGFIMLATGTDEIILFPLGGMAQLLGALLTGIAVARAGRWQGWQRFTPLALGLFNPLVAAIRATIEPTLPIEVTWMALWFLVALALYTAPAQVATPQPAAA